MTSINDVVIYRNGTRKALNFIKHWEFKAYAKTKE